MMDLLTRDRARFNRRSALIFYIQGGKNIPGNEAE